MAITQSRIVDLLLEAEGLRDSWRSLHREITNLANGLAEGKVSLDSVELHLSLMITNFHEPPSNRISVERYHFTRVYERNKREARRIAQKRAQQREDLE